MEQAHRNMLGSTRGSVVLELLIAALITGIITTAAFQFIVKMHSQAETQQHLSDAQLLCRNSLMDIKKTLRMAGYKLTGHPPYEISGDTLAVYMNGSQPVDTVKYFLEEFTEYEYSQVPDLPEGKLLFKLMKKTNSDPPAIFADYLIGLQYNAVDSSNIRINITTQTAGPDNDYQPNNGFRTFSLTELVSIRNVG